MALYLPFGALCVLIREAHRPLGEFFLAVYSLRILWIAFAIEFYMPLPFEGVYALAAIVLWGILLFSFKPFLQLIDTVKRKLS